MNKSMAPVDAEKRMNKIFTSISMKYIFFISLGFLLMCSEIKVTPSKDTLSQTNEVPEDQADTLKLIYNDIVNRPFTKIIKQRVLHELGYTIMKSKTLRNIHDIEKIDTIVTLSNNNNIFSFYVTGEKEILISFYLVDKFDFIQPELQIGTKDLIFDGKNLITLKKQVIKFQEEEEMAHIVLNIIDGKINSVSGYYAYD